MKENGVQGKTKVLKKFGTSNIMEITLKLMI